ncbi:hypothetical protein [Micromonospora sp. NPDC048830]|uniref:hypothetical protein n=1 Tax=Micromonospora sp. NPDC048830 TaxID=3364257 RepID=UPI00371F064D
MTMTTTLVVLDRVDAYELFATARTVLGLPLDGRWHLIDLRRSSYAAGAPRPGHTRTRQPAFSRPALAFTRTPAPAAFSPQAVSR